MSERVMTCYDCDKKCDLYRNARDNVHDQNDLYLVVNSCKEGCPEKYDSYSPCYPLKEREMKEHKKRFRIEFTVNVRNEGFDREDWDWSNEHIKSFALQELTCMSPSPEDITFSEVADDWHTETLTHGRCIDADKLKDTIVRCINDAEKEYPKEDFDLVKTVYESCLYHIMNAPTVLEASK